ncbi:MAG TPA: carboxypeptidase regulatory-like domain-containing protein, partial [Candidatus Angelobacter sp.]|nr:carboxypeptidase regulatory-like domain-containing protein [Candidatus Angelobacter sp.]
MSSRFTKVLLAAIALTLLLLTQSAFADNVYATVRGRVADSTGAVLPGVQVTATNTLTGASSTVTSHDDGLYEFPQLAVGTYSVSATKQGFKTFKSTAFSLDVNQVYNLAVTMQIGSTSETVEVKAEAIQVETTSIQQQTVIGSQQIVDLPLIGRNFVQLSQLAPGVMSSSDRFGSNFATNGSQTQQNTYLVNGTDSADIALNTPGILPSPDAIQEFNLISSTINPEYGRNSGGIVNALIKSGTNSFHGNAFEFYRDTFLNDRNFFTVGPQQPVFHQNLFGGTFGGPVWKDKTFFFLSYQGIRNAVATNAAGQSAPQLTTVLSPAERVGNFTADMTTAFLGNTNRTPIPLVGDDGVLYPTGTRWVCKPACATQIFHPGTANFGILPLSDFNPISLSLMNQFIPLPNAAANGFSFSPFNTTVADQGIARVDHNLTSSDLLWGVAIFNQSNATQGLPFTGATLPGFGTHSTAGTKEFTVSENHTFNSSTLNELRVGYWRLNFDAVEPNKTVAPSSFGFNINPQNPAGAQMPVIALGGLFTLGFSDNGPQPRIDENYQLTDNFSKIIGKHSLKFGFDARRFQVNNPFNFQLNGHFTFNGTGSRSTTNPAMDFLMGIPDSFAQNSGGQINARAYEYYGYGQDQWKIKNNLTLTFGAGYQVDTPYQNNQFGGLAYNCVIPGQQSKIFPTAPVGLIFPTEPGCPNGGVTIKYGHIGPRFGFAWEPHLGRISGGEGKFSIRGGFGLYFNRFEEETALQNLGAPPFGLASNGIGDIGGRPGFANPWATINNSASIPNKFPFTPPNPGDATLDFSFFEPMSINTNSPDLSTPYAMNFNLTAQREFPGNAVLSVAYVGAMGRKLYRAYEGNSITPAGQAACAADPTCVANRTFQHLFFPNHSPLPGDVFGSVGTQHTDGTSSFHSMQVNLNKGMSHGLQLITSYTWSHSIDNGSGFENSGFGGANRRGINVLNPALNVGDSASDARQRFVIGYVFAIPSLHKVANWAPDRIF